MNFIIKRFNLILVVYLIAGSFLEAQQVPITLTGDQPDLDKLIHALKQRKTSMEELRSKLSTIRQNLNQLNSYSEQGQINEAPMSKPALKKDEHSAKLIISSSPILEEVTGFVKIYDENQRSFTPVREGYCIESPQLFSVPEQGELIVSFPGKIAARIGGGSLIVIGPEEDSKYEVGLRNGTVSALLDPSRNKNTAPEFWIRTKSGVSKATGTFYAVTEYKGQAYTAVKKGTIKKETVPPSKPDFSAYLKKSKPMVAHGKSSKK